MYLSMGFLQLGVVLLAFTSHMKLQNKGRRFDKSKESQPSYPRCIIQFKCERQNHQLVKNKARAWPSRDSMGLCYNVAGYVFGLSLIECFSFLSVFALLVSHFWICYFGGMVSPAHLSIGIFQWKFSCLVFDCWYSCLTWEYKKKGRRFDKSKESKAWYPRCILQFKCYMQNHQLLKNKARAWPSRDCMGFC